MKDNIPIRDLDKSITIPIIWRLDNRPEELANLGLPVDKSFYYVANAPLTIKKKAVLGFMIDPITGNKEVDNGREIQIYTMAGTFVSRYSLEMKQALERIIDNTGKW